MYRLLEKEDNQNALRIPANDVLEREVAHLLKRPAAVPRKLFRAILRRIVKFRLLQTRGNPK